MSRMSLSSFASILRFALLIAFLVSQTVAVPLSHDQAARGLDNGGGNRE
jgi:hypothetical protein